MLANGRGVSFRVVKTMVEKGVLYRNWGANKVQIYVPGVVWDEVFVYSALLFIMKPRDVFLVVWEWIPEL